MAFSRICVAISFFWLVGALIHAIQAANDLGWYAIVVFAQLGLAPALAIFAFGKVVLFVFKRQ